MGLGSRRGLYRLAHRLVDSDPRDSLAWFAVGSYYYLIRRYDLAQRHFSRATRLDPSRAECWIGFGCSFAACDESDQALASFRAAQNKLRGGHVPLLYMGMEYLRTNHLSLAGHFLRGAQETDPSDPLVCNELGVWSSRRGDDEDAAFWFARALRLHVSYRGGGPGMGGGGSVLAGPEGSTGDDGGYVLLVGTDVEDGARRGGYRGPTTDGPTDAAAPVSTVMCAVRTPSGRAVAAPSSRGGGGRARGDVDEDAALTDAEVVERVSDRMWEPAVFNLGQALRRMGRYGEAASCFARCCSLDPVSGSWCFAPFVSPIFSMLLNIFRTISSRVSLDFVNLLVVKPSQ